MLARQAIRFVFFLAVLGPCVFGQNMWIQGRVYRSNGQPLERTVRVELHGPRASTQNIDTNSSGAFSFQLGALGEYTAVVDAGEEFEIATQSIMIDDQFLKAIAGSEGQTSWLNVYLKARDRSIVRSSTLDSKLAQVPHKALAAYGEGLKLASAGKLDEAVVELQKAIKAYPGFHQAQIELGKVFLKLGRFDDSVVSLRAALATSANEFAARLHLGMALLNLKKFGEAEIELVKASELNTAEVSPRYYLGVIKYESNDIDGALAAFEKANELNGTKPHPMLHKYLAGVYLKKNDPVRTAAELEIYLAQSPDAKDAEQIRKTIAQLKKPN